jgi:hypothetical protein
MSRDGLRPAPVTFTKTTDLSSSMMNNGLLLAAGLHRKRETRTPEYDAHKVNSLLAQYSRADAQWRYEMVNDQISAMREDEITKYHVAGEDVESIVREKELEALIQKADANIKRESNYAKLIWNFTFSIVYCVMLVFQADVTSNYALESSLHTTIINELTGKNGLQYGTAVFGDRGSVRSASQFYDWLGSSVLHRILTKPICGVSISNESD